MYFVLLLVAFVGLRIGTSGLQDHVFSLRFKTWAI